MAYQEHSDLPATHKSDEGVLLIFGDQYDYSLEDFLETAHQSPSSRSRLLRRLLREEHTQYLPSPPDFGQAGWPPHSGQSTTQEANMSALHSPPQHNGFPQYSQDGSDTIRPTIVPPVLNPPLTPSVGCEPPVVFKRFDGTFNGPDRALHSAKVETPECPAFASTWEAASNRMSLAAQEAVAKRRRFVIPGMGGVGKWFLTFYEDKCKSPAFGSKKDWKRHEERFEEHGEEDNPHSRRTGHFLPFCIGIKGPARSLNDQFADMAAKLRISYRQFSDLLGSLLKKYEHDGDPVEVTVRAEQMRHQSEKWTLDFDGRAGEGTGQATDDTNRVMTGTSRSRDISMGSLWVTLGVIGSVLKDQNWPVFTNRGLSGPVAIFGALMYSASVLVYLIKHQDDRYMPHILLTGISLAILGTKFDLNLLLEVLPCTLLGCFGLNTAYQLMGVSSVVPECEVSGEKV